MRLNREYDMMASEIIQDIIKGKLNEKTFGKMHTLSDYMNHIKFEEVDTMHISIYYEIIGKMCVIRNLLSAPLYNYLFNNDNVYIDTDGCIKIQHGRWVLNHHGVVVCNLCRSPQQIGAKDFCGTCGARMDGGAD